MSIFFTLIAFIFALGVLITFHEFGHYLIARLSGVKVLRFSVGFGRPLFVKRWGKDQTEWVIAAIPLGGYVKMLDEREGKVAHEDLPRSFNNQPVSRRFAIVAAGPIANFLLAIILYWVIFVLGISGIKPMLGPIAPMTPASFASFEAGETVMEIDNEPVPSWQEMHWKLLTLALDKSQDVNVKTVNQNGEIAQRYLDLSNLSAKDLDSNFMDKIGLSIYQPVIKPIIAQVIDDEAGYRAGLMAGDEILAVNGEDIIGWKELVDIIRSNPEQPLILEILRGNDIIRVTVTPDITRENGNEIGKIGIAPQVDYAELENLMVTVNYP
ncbi:MAG: RIP metalloprotease RseP, partial [Nitrosomonas sp.]|nr:RIP metalloprotease RseP [Nitrosomonas sp.]